MRAPCRRAPAAVVPLSASVLIVVGGCSRAGLSSFIPALELRVRAQHHAAAAASDGMRSVQRWDAVAVVSLRFRAQRAAFEPPSRYEMAPEAWVAPCDADDVVCLQEAADAERELSALLGPLQ